MDRIVNYLLKGVVTLIVSSGSYELFNGTWFGAAIFDSYSTQKSLAIVAPVSDDLYRLWGSTSFQTCLSHISPTSMILGVMLLLVLLAHVLFKPHVATALNRPQGPNDSKTLRFIRAYVLGYHVITIAIVLCLVCIYFFAPLSHTIALVFLFIAIPSSIYLLLYSKDLREGRYIERFVLVCLLLLLAVGLIEWPALYGKRVFNPDFSTAVFVSNAAHDHCDARLQKGPIFLALLAKDRSHNLFFRMCFDRNGRKFVDFFESPDEYHVIGDSKLSAVIEAFVPPVTDAEAARAVTDAATRLGAGSDETLEG